MTQIVGRDFHFNKFEVRILQNAKEALQRLRYGEAKGKWRMNQ